jgi:hypothetical protein
MVERNMSTADMSGAMPTGIAFAGDAFVATNSSGYGNRAVEAEVKLAQRKGLQMRDIRCTQ